MLVPVLIVGAGCVPPGPKETLDRYREALARGDVDAVWSLSDSAFRNAHAKEELRSALASDPGAFAKAEERLKGSGEGVRQSAEIALSGGDRALLVREDQEWRIAEGGFEPASFDTPEHALFAFFDAVRVGRWPVVRKAIPERHASKFGSDEVLRAHVAAMRARIERARAAVGPSPSGRAEIDGTKAVLTYGEGRRVTFEREGGVWRILDLE